MSGVRRKTKYRKGVEEDVLHSLPEPKEGECLVRVVASRGGNLVEVETADGSKALCRLPNRYRKVVWVKRGTLLIVDSCSEAYSTATGEEGKVKYIVNHVVFTDDQIKHLRKTGQLPSCFDPKPSEDSDGASNDLLQVNRNRRPNVSVEDSSSDEDSSEEDSADSEDEAAASSANGSGSEEDGDSDEEEEEENEESSDATRNEIVE